LTVGDDGNRPVKQQTDCIKNALKRIALKMAGGLPSAPTAKLC